MAALRLRPRLTEAYKRVLPSKATFKHIVLLTDGISEEGDSIELAKEAFSHQVTISTVGLGQDVNRAYLERIANTSGGRSYFLNDPQGLEQILLKDVKDYSGSTTIEKPLTPIVTHDAEILAGRGHGVRAGSQGLCAIFGQAFFRCDPQCRPGEEGPSVRALAIWSWARRRLYVRREKPLGRSRGFPGPALTSSGSILRATYSRTLTRPRQAPATILPTPASK